MGDESTGLGGPLLVPDSGEEETKAPSLLAQDSKTSSPSTPPPPSPPSPPASASPSSSSGSGSPVTFHEEEEDGEAPEPERQRSFSGRLLALTASMVAAARNGGSRVVRQGSRLNALARFHFASSPLPKFLAPAELTLPDLESVAPIRLPATTRRVDIDVELLTYVLSFYSTTVAELVCKEWLTAARAARFLLRDLPSDLDAQTSLVLLKRYPGLQEIRFCNSQWVNDAFVEQVVPVLDSLHQLSVLDFSNCFRLTDSSRVLLEQTAKRLKGRLIDGTETDGEESKGGLTIYAKGCYMMAVLTPQVSGAEMIRLQVLAMRHPWDAMAGMTKAFTYASPGNREATGPLSRFARMIHQGYRIMTTATRAFIYPDLLGMSGEPHCWVVRFDQGTDSQAFLWILQLQDAEDEENPGCFMTSSVLPIRATREVLDHRPWKDVAVLAYDYTHLNEKEL